MDLLLDLLINVFTSERLVSAFFIIYLYNRESGLARVIS